MGREEEKALVQTSGLCYHGSKKNVGSDQRKTVRPDKTGRDRDAQAIQQKKSEPDH